ncbi:MAG: cupin domain-containing protein [Bacteroidota bacterium]|jgi:ribosomal protein L16 Arg81 hydroxylase
MKRPALQHLLTPTSVESFITEFWEKEFLHIRRNDQQYYNEILNLSGLDEYLSRNDIRYPSLRMMRSGKAIPTAEFTKRLAFGSYVTNGLIDVDEVYKHYQQGASVVLQMMRSGIPSITSFMNRLQKDCLFNVEANVYVTPGGEQGFTTHYDTHSVMVLQIAGCKRWRLYDFPRRFPLLNETFDTIQYRPSSPTQDIVLQPGDMLYVPRGMAHDATSTNEGKSVHITIGLFPPMWRDLIQSHLGTLKNDIRLRRCPVSYLLPERRCEFVKEAKEIGETIFQGADANNMLKLTLREHLDRQSRVTGGFFGRLDRENSLNNSTLLRARNDVIFSVAKEGAIIALYFYGKRLTLPAATEPVINDMLSGIEFKVSEIKCNLDEPSKLLLARKLRVCGLIEEVEI